MTKFIVAAILAVLAVTWQASPAEACGGVAARARTAVKRVVCRVAEPLRPRAYYVVPAFVAPVPKAIPQPMPKAGGLSNEELTRRQQAAGRALLFGDAPAAKSAPVTVSRSVSPCPGGVCPVAPVRSFLRRQ